MATTDGSDGAASNLMSKRFAPLITAAIKLLDADKDVAVTKAAASIAALASHDGASMELLAEAVPKLSCVIVKSKGREGHVRRNSCAALTAVMGTHELLLQQAVLAPSREQLILSLLDMVESDPDIPTKLNAVCTLGQMCRVPEGLTEVIKAGGVRVVLSIIDRNHPQDERLEESIADIVCAFATEPTCHAQLVAEGAIDALAAMLLKSTCQEVQVRILMTFGILLGKGGTNLDNQARLAGVHGMISRLLRLTQSEDKDIKVIAQTLFRTLASNPTLRPGVEAELRAAASVS